MRITCGFTCLTLLAVCAVLTITDAAEIKDLLDANCPKACAGSEEFKFLTSYCRCSKSGKVLRFGKRGGFYDDSNYYNTLWGL